MSQPAEEGTLPYERFDTTPEKPERRLEAFREAMSVMYEVQPLDGAAREAPVIVDCWWLGSAVLIAAQVPAYSFERSSHMIARDGLDLYQIQLYQAGHCHVLRGATEAMAKPGDIMVTDLSTPIFTNEPAFRHIDILLPRALLAPLLREPDAHGGRILSGRHPLVALLGSHLESLHAQAPRLTVESVMDVLTATAQLVASAMNGCPDRRTEAGVHAALFCELRRYINGHLSDPTLTPESLAHRFGVSRATIYRLFKAEGGVAHYVQRRRLERARIDLSSSSKRHRTIAEIGEAAGYEHAQDFIRAFRREFEISPGELRDQARTIGRVQLVSKAPRLPAWSEWVRRIP
jgi:AraC-like DNA-binding protein